jgi:hypothetical protein
MDRGWVSAFLGRRILPDRGGHVTHRKVESVLLLWLGNVKDVMADLIQEQQVLGSEQGI